jgi:hypothetical protein
MAEKLEPGLYIGRKVMTSQPDGGETGAVAVVLVSGKEPWLKMEELICGRNISPDSVKKLVRIDQQIDRTLP